MNATKMADKAQINVALTKLDMVLEDIKGTRTTVANAKVNGNFSGHNGRAIEKKLITIRLELNRLLDELD